MNDAYMESEKLGYERSSKEPQMSILKLYSMGEAAANMEIGQTDLEVFPKESRTTADGEVTDHQTSHDTSGVDANGGNYSVQVKSSNSIKAKWLSRSPWLITPGLVRRGEEVLIWRVGDTDQYFWELMGTTNYLRRRDIMILAISNTGDEDIKELTAQNSVFLEFNTVDKYIQLTTPMNDGEACSFMAQLNMRDGTASFADNLGNAMAMDGPNSLIHFKNSSDSEIMLAQAVINIHAPESVNIRTPLFNVEAETTTMTGSEMTVNYENNTMNGSQMTINYEAYASTGSTFETNFATTTMGGGSFALAATESTMDVGSGMNVTGGSMDINTGSLTHKGKDVGDSHTHGGVQTGGGNTTGPN